MSSYRWCDICDEVITGQYYKCIIDGTVNGVRKKDMKVDICKYCFEKLKERGSVKDGAENEETGSNKSD